MRENSDLSLFMPLKYSVSEDRVEFHFLQQALLAGWLAAIFSTKRNVAAVLRLEC
jgi:hypothetical protein